MWGGGQVRSPKILMSDLIEDGVGADSKIGYPNWKTHFRATLAESDEARLPELISKARTAIVQRTQELSGEEGHDQEKRELWDALNSLQTLQSITRNRSR
jgi:hypothetical protein